MAKSTKSPAVVTIPGLRAHVTAIKAAYKSRESANTKIGAAVLAAAHEIKADQIETFCGMVKTGLVESALMTEGSIKVEVTRLRRVLTAVVVEGFKPGEGESLRAMYDSIPKTGKGGAPKKGAKHDAGTPDDAGKPEPVMVALTKADKRALDVAAAITTLFGFNSEELTEAVQYAVDHSGVFMSWAKASKAATTAPVVSIKAETATGKRTATKSRQRKAA